MVGAVTGAKGIVVSLALLAIGIILAVVGFGSFYDLNSRGYTEPTCNSLANRTAIWVDAYAQSNFGTDAAGAKANCDAKAIWLYAGLAGGILVISGIILFANSISVILASMLSSRSRRGEAAKPTGKNV